MSNKNYGKILLSKKIEISDGGIYPVLRRLKKDECLDTYLKESTEGPPRKYYTLTTRGDDLRQSLLENWIFVKEGINSMVEEDVENE